MIVIKSKRSALARPHRALQTEYESKENSKQEGTGTEIKLDKATYPSEPDTPENPGSSTQIIADKPSHKIFSSPDGSEISSTHTHKALEQETANPAEE